MSLQKQMDRAKGHIFLLLLYTLHLKNGAIYIISESNRVRLHPTQILYLDPTSPWRLVKVRILLRVGGRVGGGRVASLISIK